MGWQTVEYSIDFIAQKLGAEVLGPGGSNIIRRIAAQDDPTPDAISFCKRLPKNSLACGAMLCEPSVAARLSSIITCIVVPDPIRALVEIAPLFYQPDPPSPGVHRTAVIDSTAEVSPLASIGAYCVIESHARIGDHTVIHPHVCIYPRVTIGKSVVIHANCTVREDTEIGDYCVIQPGAAIGADGFGYIPDSKQGLIPVPQMGSVKLADYVDVGANSCIDRATIGKTSIGIGTKIDNLVQIAHNVVIGSNSMICGQVGIAGSSTVGNQVVMGGNAGVADHVEIVDRVRLAAKTAVIHDIREPGDYGGYPAVPAKEWRKSLVAVRRLANQLQNSTPRTKPEE